MTRPLALLALFVLTPALGVLASPTVFRFTEAGGPFPADVLGALPASDGVPGPVGSPATCAGCHAEIATEWQSSMHAQSFEDPVFRAELRETRNRATCAGCHAPLDAALILSSTAASVGIACAACHVREGMILGTHASGPTTPHRVRVVAELADSSFCGGCHDFDFPPMSTTATIPYSTEIPQQATFAEWRESHAASEGRTCITCHMPEVARAGGRFGRSHRMADLRTPAFVADALTVRSSMTRVGETWNVRVELAVRDAGHSVPTGDIFRVLRVRVTNGRASAERSLRRRFTESWNGHSWERRDSVDERVHAGEARVVELRVPYDDSDVHFDVSILRLDHAAAMRRQLPESTVVIPLARGVVSRPSGH